MEHAIPIGPTGTYQSGSGCLIVTHGPKGSCVPTIYEYPIGATGSDGHDYDPDREDG